MDQREASFGPRTNGYASSAFAIICGGLGSLTSHARSPWLSLGEASRLLGITPGTLRRWADQGDVAAFVTPGGHRRFPRSAIESLVPQTRTRRPLLTGLTASASR